MSNTKVGAVFFISLAQRKRLKMASSVIDLLRRTFAICMARCMLLLDPVKSNSTRVQRIPSTSHLPHYSPCFFMRHPCVTRQEIGAPNSCTLAVEEKTRTACERLAIRTRTLVLQVPHRHTKMGGFGLSIRLFSRVSVGSLDGTTKNKLPRVMCVSRIVPTHVSTSLGSTLLSCNHSATVAESYSKELLSKDPSRRYAHSASVRWGRLGNGEWGMGNAEACPSHRFSLPAKSLHRINATNKSKSKSAEEGGEKDMIFPCGFHHEIE